MKQTTFPRLTLVPILVGVLLLVAGCDSNDPEGSDSQIAEVQISPQSASIEVGEQVDFSFVALSESGETLPTSDLEVRWWSSDTTVFKVEEDGTATGQAVGSAFCMIEVTSLRIFTGRDSVFVSVFAI